MTSSFEMEIKDKSQINVGLMWTNISSSFLFRFVNIDN